MPNWAISLWGKAETEAQTTVFSEFYKVIDLLGDRGYLLQEMEIAFREAKTAWVESA